MRWACDTSVLVPALVSWHEAHERARAAIREVSCVPAQVLVECYSVLTRLGARAASVTWQVGDITQVALPRHAYAVWHDRAVFHFLTTPEERAAYVEAVLHAVQPGGHVIVATFAEDGPDKCSGLPVVRYSADGLHAEFGAPFTLLGHAREAHQTPFGSVQKFIYCLCRKWEN